MLSFDRSNPKDVVIKVNDFKGVGLNYIYINGKLIPSNSLKIENDKIIIRDLVENILKFGA